MNFPLVDWISFTVDAPMDRKGINTAWLDPLNVKICRRQALTQIYRKVGKDVMDTLFGSLPCEEEAGRMPYKYAIRDDLTSAQVMFDSRLDHIAIEISGKGCRALAEKDQITKLVAVVSANCSRIDLALDVRTDTDPIDFINAGWDKRFTSHAKFVSDTGTTAYIGSPKSEKRAAIYRYKPPHPRSAFLRIEHRYRGNSARHMCNYVGVNGIAMGVAYAGLHFDWKHDLWPKGEIRELPLPDLGCEAKDANLAAWLLKQVFPAMRRAEREGQIDDLRAFCQLYLFEDEQE